MAPYTPTPGRQFSGDTPTWDSLKRAISASSGFQRWQAERLISDAETVEHELSALNQDQRVRRYLRETLETLAY